MKSITLAVAALALNLATARAAEVSLNGQTFTLPDGFEIEVAAGPSLVERPITADFDEEGRLYVAESSGTNDAVQKQLAEKPHRILRLEDTDGDGRFDERTVFADRMMFPEGTMWLDGSLYVAAPPSIWKLTDTDGDGIADERVEWFQGKTLTGCANDLHGPYRGPDGWIYWCKGAFAEQTYERPGREPLVTRAAHIFRCRPDGTGIEHVMTGGMDNPVDVVFTPGGERIFTTTFFQHPGGGQRDGLIHAVYGGVYGKVHDVIEGHPRTSPDVMPVLTHLGPAAPCGLTTYESEIFGEGYRGNLFAALFNMQKVTRHVLEPAGGTFTTRDEDFLVSDDKDFHPTDVLADADGSLVVIDTGGWYKLCCPTSQLWKPDVLGAIYRVRRAGAPRVEDPRGRSLDWNKVTDSRLGELLDDPRPAVRNRAIATLARRGPGPFAFLAPDLRSAEARRNAVWALTRSDSDTSVLVLMALIDKDPGVQQVAAHSAGLRRDNDAVPLLINMLRSESLHSRRAAAEALGRIGDSTAIPALLDALADAGDRVLEHSLTFALIEIADPAATARGLDDARASVRRAALVALDQMPGDHLPAEALVGALRSEGPAIRDAATWIAGHHPEWEDELAEVFRGRLSAEGLTPAERAELEQQLARLARTGAVQALLAEGAGDESASAEERETALRAMGQSGMKRPPPSWREALTAALASGDARLVSAAVGAVRALSPKHEDAGELVAPLAAVAGDERLSNDLRLAALAAVPGGVRELDPDVFGFVRSQLDPELSVATRGLATDVLSRATLSGDQLVSLAESLKTAGPLELDRLLSAYEQSSDERVGRALLAALGEASSLASLRVETLQPRLKRFGDAVEQTAGPLYARINAGREQQQARLEGMLGSLGEGDVRRGQLVFNSRKSACASCHAIGYLGGTAGPDLTRIGQIRTERDLLESIIFPSASLVRSFEPVTVLTTGGKVHNGLVRREAPDEILLATGPNQEVRIPRDEIEELRPSSVSIMPAGLDEQLTKQELADLVAFLKACR